MTIIESTGSLLVSAEPYDWPYTGAIDLQHTALVLIDWQYDFCGPGGYVETMGYDIALTRAPIAAVQSVLAAWRAHGAPSSTRRRATRPTSRTARPTSSGAPSRSAPASATRVHADGSSFAASRDGRSSTSLRRSRARW